MEDYSAFNRGVRVRVPPGQRMDPMIARSDGQKWKSSSRVERPVEARQVMVRPHPLPQGSAPALESWAGL